MSFHCKLDESSIMRWWNWTILTIFFTWHFTFLFMFCNIGQSSTNLLFNLFRVFPVPDHQHRVSHLNQRTLSDCKNKNNFSCNNSEAISQMQIFSDDLFNLLLRKFKWRSSFLSLIFSVEWTSTVTLHWYRIIIHLRMIISNYYLWIIPVTFSVSMYLLSTSASSMCLSKEENVLIYCLKTRDKVDLTYKWFFWIKHNLFFISSDHLLNSRININSFDCLGFTPAVPAIFPSQFFFAVSSRNISHRTPSLSWVQLWRVENSLSFLFFVFPFVTEFSAVCVLLSFPF